MLRWYQRRNASKISTAFHSNLFGCCHFVICDILGAKLTRQFG